MNEPSPRPRSRRAPKPNRRPRATVLEAGSARLEPRLLPTIITPFTARYTTNANGDIAFVANTLMSAPGNGTDAVRARNGTGSNLNDDDFNMAYVDVDSDGSTFNSSRADLALPAGGSILFAGLYWGAESSSGSRNSVRFQTPGSAGYATVTGSILGAASTADYQGFADVTSQVRAAGAGTYAVANVQANTGSNKAAGWSLVVVYGDPSAPPRNLTVFDGYVIVDSATPNVSIPISGFRAPNTGPVNATVGIVAYEGDLGLTGDSVTFNGRPLTDSKNPNNNFFNSTISNRGSLVTAKNPNYVNQLGFDADLVSASGFLDPGATSTTINLKTNSDQYYPGVVTTAIDLYAPVVNVAKTVVDLNGGGVEPGDVLEYTSVIQVVSGEAATNFVYLDPIPDNVQFQPGSISIDGASRTDAAGDDQADFQGALNRVTYRLGTGANASNGGVMAVGSTATVRFRVVVNGTAMNGDVIAGQGTASFVGQGTLAGLSAVSNVTRSTVARADDLALTQTVSNASPEVGEEIDVVLSVANTADFLVAGVAVTDLLPAGLTFVSATASQGTYAPSTGLWTVGNVDGLSPATLTIRARVVATAALTNIARITAADQPDPNAANDEASVAITPRRADLRLAKAVSVARPNVGDRITFTTTLTNLGPAAASNVRIEDRVPAGFTLVSGSSSSAEVVYDQVAGVWTISSLPVGSITLTLVVDVTGSASATTTSKVLSSGTYDPVGSNDTASATINPQKVDVSIAKTVDVGRPNVGQAIVLTTRVKNVGVDAATGVVVASPIGAGLTYESVQAPAGTSYDPATGTWTVGGLAASQELVLRVTVRVSAPAAVVSTASLAGLDQWDATTADDSASVSVTPQSADLAPTVAISDAAPVAGQNVTLTVKVKNSGPDAATGVKVLEALPAGFQFVSASADQGTYDAATGLWTVGTVASGATRTLTIVAKVTAAGTSTHTASVAAVDQHDPNAGNNAASVTTTALTVDLALASAFSRSSPKVGEQVDYVVTLTAPGTADATGVQVSAPLPAGLTFVSATPGAGTYNQASGVWTVGPVARGSTIVLTIRATVGAAAVSGATATATLSASSPADAVAANNVATASLTAQSANLVLSATVDKAVPKMGETMTFRVTVTNAGPNDATGIVVTHEIPPTGMLFLGVSGPGAYDALTGAWSLGSIVLKPGESRTLALQAQALDADPRTIHASITGTDQFDPTPGDNAASVTFDAQRADLSVSAGVDVADPKPGQVVTFTVVAANNGPDAATNVRIRNLLPPGLAFRSATADRGTYRTSDGVWQVGGLAAGSTGSATLTITAVAVSPDSGDFTATLQSPEQYDGTPADDVASAFVAPRVADLYLTSSVDFDRPNVGDLVTVSFLINNYSIDAAENVTLSAPIPAGLIVEETVLPPGSTYDAATGTLTIPSLIGADSAMLILRLRVDAPTIRPFTATISGADAYDPTPDDRTATVTVTPLQADLSVSASADVTRPNAGQLVTFTITLADVGPDAATGAVVSAPLPAGYAYASSSATAGSYDPGTGLWTVGAVAPGTPVVLTLAATVTAATVPPLVASIADVDQYDPASLNNSASVSIRPRKVDLVVGKVVDSPTPNVDDLIRYTIVVKNGGEDDATGVLVGDVLPAGMDYQMSAADFGAYDLATGVWTVGGLAKGAEARLTIWAIVIDADATVNTASVVSVDQFDLRSQNDGAQTSVTPQQAELMVTAIVDDPSPLVGDLATFTIDLKNLGKDDANGVAVTVALPAGLAFDSASPSVGTYDPSTGVWTIGDVPLGVTAVLTLRARVTTAEAATLSASITAADQFDPNPATDSASSTVQAQVADLGLSFSIDDDRPTLGQVVTVTLDLRNAGPDDATGVLATLPIPAGFEYVSHTVEAGSYDAVTGVWTVGSRAAGSTTRIVLRLRSVGGDPVTVEASVVGDQFDPVPDDGSIAAVVTPQRADLAVVATVDRPTPDALDVVAFTITLTNDGPDDATAALALATLPAGLQYVSSQASRGTYDPTTGIWTLASAPSGSSTVLTIYARVVSPSPSTLTVIVAGADQFDPDAGDRTASVTVTPKRADVRVVSTVDNLTPNVGDLVTVTVTVSNLGPDGATGVAVDSLLPPGLEIVGIVSDQGEFAPLSGRWSVGDLPAGGSLTLVYQYRVGGPAPFTGVTTVAALDQFNASTGPPASYAIAPRMADVAVSMAVDRARPNVGELVTYTVVATNAGPDAAVGLRIATGLGAGLAFESTDAGVSYDPISGEWTVGDLAPGETRTIHVVARVTAPGVQAMTARVAFVDEFDPTDADREATAAVESQQVRLALTQTVDVATPVAGQVVAYTIVLSNAGPDAATNVRISQPLPPGVAWESASSAGATYDPATGVWTIPSVPAGGSVVLTLRGLAVAPGEQVVTASLIAADQFDAEPAGPASVAINPQRTSVAVAAVVDAPRPDAGQLVLVTITATNSGPDAATGLSIATALPPGLAFESSAPGAGIFDAKGIWRIDSLAPGASATLQVWARATGPWDSSIAAGLTHVDQFDATTADDSASVAVSPHRADVSVRIEGVPGVVEVGKSYEIRVIVANAGPDGATGVAVPIAVPAGFRLVSTSPGLGSYDPTTGVWAVGAIPSGGSYSLGFVLEAIAPGEFELTAGPATSRQFDPTPGDDLSSAHGVARNPADPTPPVDPPVDPPVVVPPVDPPIVVVPPVDPPVVDPVVPEPPAATAGRLTGVVYLDRNRNGVFDAGVDLGVATIHVVLIGVDDRGQSVRFTATTGADGSFAFDGLRPGTYNLVQQAPARYFRSTRASAGSLGGIIVAGGAEVQQVVVSAGSAGAGYDFGNLPRPGCRMDLLVGRAGVGRAVPRGPILGRFFPGAAAARRNRMR